jgi:hypothetical protein
MEENEASARGAVDFSAGSVRGHILRFTIPYASSNKMGGQTDA